MKEQYIKQVEKELSLTRKAKKEVVRDLNEVFASALEHGETEQQVIERLGTPKEFAENTAEQLGIDSAAPQKRKGIISSVAALVVAVAAFVIFRLSEPSAKTGGSYEKICFNNRYFTYAFFGCLFQSRYAVRCG